MRLIDADKVIDDIIDDKYNDEYGGEYLEGKERAIDLIESAHTVEERHHGEWKPLGQPDELGIHSWHICSNCSFQTTWHMVDIFHFCPNCGSDMRQKEGDAE